MTAIFLITIVITVTVAIICGAIFRRRSRNVQGTKSVKHTTKDPDSLAPQKITAIKTSADPSFGGHGAFAGTFVIFSTSTFVRGRIPSADRQASFPPKADQPLPAAEKNACMTAR